MTTAHDLQTGSIADRFDHLAAVMGSPKFLRMEGLGKEVPFFVVPYSPMEENGIQKLREQLTSKLKHKGIRVLEVNLFDLSKELMDSMGDWDYWIENEQSHSKDDLLKAIQSLTDAQTKLAPAFAEKIKEAGDFEIMFISGVGESFPFIRSHTVLNNIQSVAKTHPTVMFFPGDYSYSIEEGASLDLFGKLRDDKYYRAFNMYEREA